MKALKNYRHRLIPSGKSEAWAKTQTRCQDVCSMFYLSSNNFYGIFIYSEIRSSLLATTEVPLHSQSTQAPELQDAASQGAAYHPVHSRSWHLPNHQETKTTRRLFRVWGFLLGPPLLLTKFSQCPQQLSGGCGGTNVSFFLPLTLSILLDQGYHRHSNKSSNNCTKTTVSNKNKKQKPATKPLGALHCLCRWP